MPGYAASASVFASIPGQSAEREVGAVEQAPRVDEVQQRVDVAGEREPGADLVVQPLQRAEHVDLARLAPADAEEAREAGQPVGHDRQRRACVRDDEADAAGSASSVPVSTRLAIARVVSSRNSSIGRG